MNTQKTILVLASISAILLIAAASLPRRAQSPQPGSPAAETTAPHQGNGYRISGAAAKAEASPSPVRRAPSAATAPGQPVLPAAESEFRTVSIADALCDAGSSHASRQAAWDKIRKAGKWDETIAELEQRMKDDPANPMAPAALGQACLMKAGTLTDVREQGVLGLKADQLLDQALKLDEGNWDARFWKASAMSYWPPMMGKTTEVIEQFLTLVKQQESGRPEPHFAQTYVLLGDQYKKQGRADYAEQIWRRGQALYPSQSDLASRLQNN